MLKNEIIESEKLDIYIYGFEVMISSICGFAIAAILGLLFWKFWESMLFLIVFISMRSYCGGYHADTYLKCNSVFAFTMSAVMLLVTFVPQYSVWVHPVVSAACLLTVLALAPVENEFKPLDEPTRRKCRIISIILLLLFGCGGVLLHRAFFQWSLTIDIALFIVAVSMIVEVIVKRGEKNEKC